MISKPQILVITNAALYLVTCALVGTGLLLELRMDIEDGPARLFGMGKDDWGEIHSIVAILFGALASFHLAQHWAWIRSVFRRSKLAMALVFVGLACVASLLTWPTTSTNPSGAGAFHDD